MKKHYLQIFLAILFLLGLQFNSAFAGDKIKIHLQQPPPNMLGVSDLWKLTLENTTREDLTIFLEGTVTESKDGLIVEGQSKPFVIKPGKTSYGYNDFKKGSVSWKNNKYQEAIVRTGNAPSGSYTICVTAKLENGEVTGKENCIEQKIEITGEKQITLVSPSDGEEIDPDTLPGIMFAWRECPMCPPMYTLRIVEIKGEQSPDVAMQNNATFFEEKSVRGTTFQYSQSAPKLEKGKTYGWQISNGDTKSEVWKFSMMMAQYQVIVDTVIVSCDPHGPSPNCYQYQVKVRNNNAAGSPGPTSVSKASIISTTPSASSITPALGTLSTGIAYLGTYTFSGSICFSTPPSSISFVVKMQDNTNPVGYNATTTYTVNAPNCNKNCCDGFVKEITQSVVSGGLNVTMKAGPKPIKKVTISLVYIKSVTDPNCPICKRPEWGSFLCLNIFGPGCPLGGFGGQTDEHNREISWVNNAGVDMYNTPRSGVFFVIFDPVYLGAIADVLMKCCKTDIDYCFRYSFTDTSCVTCDTVICSKLSIGGSTHPVLDDSIRVKYKMIEEQMKNGEKPHIHEHENEERRENEEEYKNGKDEQDEIMKKNKKEGEGQSYSSEKYEVNLNRKAQAWKGAK